MSAVQGQRYLDIAKMRADKVAGSFEMVANDEPTSISEVKGIRFICPCGCGNESWMPVNRETVAEAAQVPGPSWALSGTLDAPTTKPSVLQSGLPCKWHGYLTDGVWTSC